ncbi:MAG: FecCD family ABC transporter permease [Micrococcaceae bacterium]
MTALTSTPSTDTAPATPAARRPRSRLAWLVVLLLVVLALTAASISIGSRQVGFEDLIAGLTGQVENVSQGAIAKRVPRTVLALLAGAALAVSGTVMQGVTRNPLADPGILGVNMGAQLAVVIGMAWFGLFAFASMIWVAIVGAAVTAVFVYAIGSLGRGGSTPLKLALAGAATSAALTSFVTAVVLPRNDIAGSVRSWQIGGVGGATYPALQQVLPVLVIGFLICWFSARSLNSLALGDDLAAGLGERVALARGAASLGAVMLCGAATAICGPIGFVGLVIPHVCRLLIGVDHRWLIPFAAVTGAGLLTAADVLGRIVARPSELDVGIITALVGAPFFIYIVRRQKVREL